MDSRERIRAAIEHRELDRIPTDFWATTEVQEALFAHFGIEEGKGGSSPWIGLNGGALSRGIEGILRLFEILHIDGMFHVQAPYKGPKKRVEGDIEFNEWGFGYRKKPYAYGTYSEQVVFPLADAQTVQDIAAYAWPDPDWYDYGALPGLIGRCGGRAVTIGYSAQFTFHNYLRGLETSLMDTYLSEDLTRELLSRLSDFFTEYHRRCFEAAGKLIDTTQVTDDWGSQSGPIVSPDVFRTFYRDHTKRAIDLAHGYGIKVFHHDDGDCRAFLPDLAEMGIEVLNPIQYRCGNWDLVQLKKDYGQKICFHSGVDNQETLPLGTPDTVRAEVRHLIDTLASNGTGFIIGPCHNLQPNTPLGNIIALYEEAWSYGGR